MDIKSFILSISRYLLVVALSWNSLYLFYFIFTPLTVYPLYFLLNLFYEAILVHGVDMIQIGGFQIFVVEACVAGAAYFLLVLLNLLTRMDLKKRIYSLLFSFFLFWSLNIIRLFVFSVLFVRRFSLFNFLHQVFWYFLSGVLVFLVWIITIKIFKIKSVPIVDDLKPLFKESIFFKKTEYKKKTKGN